MGTNVTNIGVNIRNSTGKYVTHIRANNKNVLDNILTIVLTLVNDLMYLYLSADSLTGPAYLFEGEDVKDTCYHFSNVRSRLTDSLINTCIHVPIGVTHIELVPDPASPITSSSSSTSSLVSIMTDHLPCSQRFHVSVTAMCPGNCPTLQTCQLVSHRLLQFYNDEFCGFECACADGVIVKLIKVRLVALEFGAHVCDILWGVK